MSNRLFYGGHWAERTDTNQRHAVCLHCGYRTSVPRRGWKGGALTACAKLRAAISKHVRSEHPDKVENA